MKEHHEFFKETMPPDTEKNFNDVLHRGRVAFAERLMIDVIKDAYNRPAKAEASKDSINKHIQQLKPADISVNDLHPAVWALAQKVVMKAKLD